MTPHRHRLLSRCLALLSGVMLGSLAGLLPAFSMSLVEQVPAVTEITDGSALAFALRFDQPITWPATPRRPAADSHSTSRLAALAG
jgi:hypothetical protein